MKYYYKLPALSETGKRLRKFNSQAILALRRADAYAKRMGAVAYHSSNDAFAGGVAFLIFEKEPNPTVFRVATKIDDELCYEPNVKLDSGVVVVKKNELPKDEPDCLYDRSKLLSWADVCDRYSLATWAQTANITDADKMTEDALREEITKRMKDRNFISYLRISDMPVPDLVQSRQLRKGARVHLRAVRPSVKVASRAVTAERQRMALPIMSISSLLDILTGGNTTVAAECGTTPIFFEWQRNWYIGVDVPCDDNKDMQLIESSAFTFMLNTKKQTLAREAADFDEYCKEEKAERERLIAEKKEIDRLKGK
jgi:hypothetical protein